MTNSCSWMRSAKQITPVKQQLCSVQSDFGGHDLFGGELVKVVGNVRIEGIRPTTRIPIRMR